MLVFLSSNAVSRAQFPVCLLVVGFWLKVFFYFYLPTFIFEPVFNLYVYVINFLFFWILKIFWHDRSIACVCIINKMQRYLFLFFCLFRMFKLNIHCNANFLFVVVVFLCRYEYITDGHWFYLFIYNYWYCNARSVQPTHCNNVEMVLCSKMLFCIWSQICVSSSPCTLIKI